jgi:hypothetical protein
MEADAFLAFLWNGDLPGVNYDPDNMMDGFLDGFVLERVSITTTPLFMLLTLFPDHETHIHRPFYCVWCAIMRNTSIQCHFACHDYC